MSGPPYMSSRSPPPLQHPKPTHPAYPPPEPPHTPAASTNSSPYSQAQRISQDGYVRYSSPPVSDTSTSASTSGFNAYNPQHQANPGSGLGGNQAGMRAGYTAAQSPGVPPGPGQPQGYQSMMGLNIGGGNGANGFGAWPGMNDATAQMGVQFGKSAVAAGQDYVEKNFTRYLPLHLIKVSFSVTNTYVLNKLRLVLFPWRHKPWSRQVRRSTENGAMEGWQAPRDDINAPDLYIPTMALVTYTLLSALASGLQSRFHPEVLGLSLSKALAVVILEFCAIKLGCYLLDVRGGGASGVELIGYGGYKFVGIIATIVVSMLGFGRLVTIGTFVYVFGANAFFLTDRLHIIGHVTPLSSMIRASPKGQQWYSDEDGADNITLAIRIASQLRSLKYVLLPDASVSAVTTTLSHGQRSRRVQFLFFMAMSQVLWMGWLSRV
ncbi:ER to Golgi transporter Yif1 [Kwoniella heveanensis BCC8398]|uniref:ER to Golgi transporter Yif1 n=1 Tax=Kwoniella heveanensis BCC8398 TaxID=1296120 RepID=A0A1B9GRH7_9TREE|nr:ER to Golgi transporter Yif1 [Kwoniella heveanensis BCC8398]